MDCGAEAGTVSRSITPENPMHRETRSGQWRNPTKLKFHSLTGLSADQFAVSYLSAASLSKAPVSRQQKEWERI
jgi:hemolysin activation/secretion protein